MSLDLYLSVTLYERNVTHNLGRMAREAGLYDAMWRPEEQGWMVAGDLIEPLRAGLETLRADPEHFKQFNPDNGWGDYDGLVEAASSYLAACMTLPHAAIRTSR